MQKFAKTFPLHFLQENSKLKIASYIVYAPKMAKQVFDMVKRKLFLKFFFSLLAI